ncbi:hypothetical protein JWZ98_03270 [Methylomonas sp. EFPC1]|uniref:hypothetical protein n=1 Tax=Methylomonas sp. EFPC1 TaxID=2812647 RepID=UPI001967B24C|nr:hypothetical protein [Methylomonas sp. EFPC1]QSB01996.1 hypothetical protein JWZ98_03270 [Methylomonas sp. EFPC1]
MKRYLKKLHCWYFGHKPRLVHTDCNPHYDIYICDHCEKEYEGIEVLYDENKMFFKYTRCTTPNALMITLWAKFARLLFGERKCTCCGKRDSSCECFDPDVPF